jgi:hypothetical protein
MHEHKSGRNFLKIVPQKCSCFHRTLEIKDIASTERTYHKEAKILTNPCKTKIKPYGAKEKVSRTQNYL